MKRIIAVMYIAAASIMLCSCGTPGGYGSQYNDPVAGFLTDLNHAIAPAAARNEYMRGNYNRANQIQAQDAVFQMMNSGNYK